MKKSTVLFLTIVLYLFSSSVSFADIFDDSEVKVNYNGVEQKFNPNPVIWNNSTLVPFRQVFELYGAKVQWDQGTKTVVAVKGDTTIKIITGSNKAFINNKEAKLAQGPIIAKGTVFVGLRFISEALGGEVSFDKQNLTVNIESSE